MSILGGIINHSTAGSSETSDPTPTKSHSGRFESSSSQYLSISNASQTGLNLSSDFTFEIWFKLEDEASSGNVGLVSKRDGTGGYEAFIHSSNRRFQVNFFSSGNQSQFISDNDLLIETKTDKWQHFAISVDISVPSAQMYLNGVKINTTVNQNAATSIGSTTTDLIIGARDASGSGSPSAFFKGNLSEVRIWDDIRTHQEIIDNAGKVITGSEANLVAYWKLDNGILDETSNDNDLTNNNSVTFEQDIPFSEAPTNKVYFVANYLCLLTLIPSDGDKALLMDKGISLMYHGTITQWLPTFWFNGADTSSFNVEIFDLWFADNVTDTTGDLINTLPNHGSAANYTSSGSNRPDLSSSGWVFADAAISCEAGAEKMTTTTLDSLNNKGFAFYAVSCIPSKELNTQNVFQASINATTTDTRFCLRGVGDDWRIAARREDTDTLTNHNALSGLTQDVVNVVGVSVDYEDSSSAIFVGRATAQNGVTSFDNSFLTDGRIDDTNSAFVGLFNNDNDGNDFEGVLKCGVGITSRLTDAEMNTIILWLEALSGK